MTTGAEKQSTTAGMGEAQRALQNWMRYQYVQQRGHREYIQQALRCERFYLGAGLQWDEQAKAQLAETNRPASEENNILPMINAAVGYQIANRMDIQFTPRGDGANDETAATLTKVAKQVSDNVKLHWKETLVFEDGLIQQRGYFEFRMSYEDNLLGEIAVDVLDPLDVMPDPDSKDYDPDQWKDVTITRWWTLDDIEQRFGKPARTRVENSLSSSDGDYGDMLSDEERNRFGKNGLNSLYYDSVWESIDTRRVRIIDRQYWCYELTDVLVFPQTMDVRVIAGMDEAVVQQCIADGAVKTKRMMRRVHWLVTTSKVVLHDDKSPYPWLTVVPFFPIFRRGITRGLVDNGISPQETLNKAISQFITIVNTTANSGYDIEENQLVNMDVEGLKKNGGKPGLVLVRKQGTPPINKIPPNPVPSGIVELADRSRIALQNAVGVNEAMMADEKSTDLSGVAIQARQYAAQQKLAKPLDQLARTRNMVGSRILDLIQRFMDGPRIMRIVTTDDTTGEETTEELPVNMPQPDGTKLNDLSLGEYDIVISEQPMQVTFENTQFEQAIRLVKEAQVPIPPERMVRYSSLADRGEVAKLISEQAGKADPLTDAEIALKNAQTEKTRAEAVNKSVEGMFSATRAATEIATVPQVAGLADELLQSAGFEDKNAPPIVPQIDASMIPAAPLPGENTNPLTPPNPDVGMNAGIETGVAQ